MEATVIRYHSVDVSSSYTGHCIKERYSKIINNNTIIIIIIMMIEYCIVAMYKLGQWNLSIPDTSIIRTLEFQQERTSYTNLPL